MSNLNMISQLYNIDHSWTLFLDRDGVINRKRDRDYVKNWGEFEFLPGALEGIRILSSVFGRLLIATNQRGVGRGLMSETDLENIHQRMLKKIGAAGGRIDKIYCCTHLAENDPEGCRKPKPGMAFMAKSEFPEVDFKTSIMVGDSLTDMEFGKNAGMKTVYISASNIPSKTDKIDIQFESLYAFSQWILQHAIAN